MISKDCNCSPSGRIAILGQSYIPTVFSVVALLSRCGREINFGHNSIDIFWIEGKFGIISSGQVSKSSIDSMVRDFNLENGGSAVFVVRIIVCCNGWELVEHRDSSSKDGYNGMKTSFGQPSIVNLERLGNKGGSAVWVVDPSVLHHPFNSGQAKILSSSREGNIVLMVGKKKKCIPEQII